MVQHRRNSIKIGVHLPFGPRSPMEFEAFFRKKIWPGQTGSICLTGFIKKVYFLPIFELIQCVRATQALKFDI